MSDLPAAAPMPPISHQANMDVARSTMTMLLSPHLKPSHRKAALSVLRTVDAELEKAARQAAGPQGRAEVETVRAAIAKALEGATGSPDAA